MYVEPNSDKNLAAKFFKCENDASDKDPYKTPAD